MKVQLLLVTATALAVTPAAASTHTRHHHKHHARGPNVAQQQPRVVEAMKTLKAMSAKLGPPRLEGNEAVGGKDAPGLYFGKAKMNNNFDIVDAVGVRDGKGMTATLFAKGGDEYIRVSTSVPKPDGSGRAIGTVLAGPALESIKAGKAYYGEVTILGTPYTTGYEPIRIARERRLASIMWATKNSVAQATRFVIGRATAAGSGVGDSIERH